MDIARFSKNKLFHRDGEKPNQYALQVATEFMKEMEEFMTHLPLISSLHRKCLLYEHWEEIEKVTQIEALKIEEFEGFKLNLMIEIGMEAFNEKLEEISIKAHNQSKIREGLNRIKDMWGDKKLTIIDKDGKLLLADIDDMVQLLDDKIQELQGMKNSTDAIEAKATEKDLNGQKNDPDKPT